MANAHTRTGKYRKNSALAAASAQILVIYPAKLPTFAPICLIYNFTGYTRDIKPALASAGLGEENDNLDE